MTKKKLMTKSSLPEFTDFSIVTNIYSNGFAKSKDA